MVFEQILTIGYWMALVISSILGMIAIIIGIEIVHERPSVVQAFIVSALANIITSLGILGIIATFLPLPYAYFIISAIIWILLIKFFFPVNWQHAIIIGIVGFAIMEAFDFFGITSQLIAMIRF